MVWHLSPLSGPIQLLTAQGKEGGELQRSRVFSWKDKPPSVRIPPNVREASQVYVDCTANPSLSRKRQFNPGVAVRIHCVLQSSMGVLAGKPGLRLCGGSESVYSVVFPALQPPISEEFGRKRHSSTPGEESTRHRLPSLSATPPPPAALPASAGGLLEKPLASRDNSP